MVNVVAIPHGSPHAPALRGRSASGGRRRLHQSVESRQVVIDDGEHGDRFRPDPSPCRDHVPNRSDRTAAQAVVPMVRSSGCIRSYKAILWLVAVGVWLIMPSLTIAQQSGSQADARVSHDEILWHAGDIDSAFAAARAARKPVLLYWGADWCPPSSRLKATVFRRPEFVERTRQFVAVNLDGDEPGAQRLGKEFGVDGYPTTGIRRLRGRTQRRSHGLGPAERLVAESQLPATLKALEATYPSPLAVENSRLFMAYLAAHALADWGDEGASALPDEELRWARARLQEIPQDPAQVQAKIGLRQLGWVHMCAITGAAAAGAAGRGVVVVVGLTSDRAGGTHGPRSRSRVDSFWHYRTLAPCSTGSWAS